MSATGDAYPAAVSRLRLPAPPPLDRNGRLVLVGKAVRAFGFGLGSVVLGLYLVELGLDAGAVGAVLSAALIGTTILTLGIAIYGDRHGIFHRDPRQPLTLAQQLRGVRRPLTQVGRALHELGIRWIPASSPQAKGRIERLWGRSKEWRAIATRYEKTATSFLGILCFAAAMDWLKS